MKRLRLPMVGSVIVTLAAGPHLTVSAQSSGTIGGHVKLTGTPPPNAVIKMGADPNCLKINAGKRVVEQTVVRAPDGGLMNVFVNVKGSFPQAGASPAAVIDQQGCVYHPRVQGARVGRLRRKQIGSLARVPVGPEELRLRAIDEVALPVPERAQVAPAQMNSRIKGLAVDRT